MKALALAFMAIGVTVIILAISAGYVGSVLVGVVLFLIGVGFARLGSRSES